MENLMFGVTFVNQDAKTLFQNLEEQEQTEISIRLQIEAFKAEYRNNPKKFLAELRNSQLKKMGLHPIMVV